MTLSLSFREVGKTSGLEHLELHPSSEPSHAFLLTGLGKFTSYQVVIQGLNSQGEGPPSTSVVATTMEDGEDSLCLNSTRSFSLRTIVHIYLYIYTIQHINTNNNTVIPTILLYIL